MDSGCIFVGHGLTKDFETANIFVPPEQVRLHGYLVYSTDISSGCRFEILLNYGACQTKGRFHYASLLRIY